LKEIKLKR